MSNLTTLTFRRVGYEPGLVRYKVPGQQAIMNVILMGIAPEHRSGPASLHKYSVMVNAFSSSAIAMVHLYRSSIADSIDVVLSKPLRIQGALQDEFSGLQDHELKIVEVAGTPVVTRRNTSYNTNSNAISNSNSISNSNRTASGGGLRKKTQGKASLKRKVASPKRKVASPKRKVASPRRKTATATATKASPRKKRLAW